jgi:hypothetical protein
MYVYIILDPATLGNLFAIIEKECPRAIVRVSSS